MRSVLSGGIACEVVVIDRNSEYRPRTARVGYIVVCRRFYYMTLAAVDAGDGLRTLCAPVSLTVYGTQMAAVSSP